MRREQNVGTRAVWVLWKLFSSKEVSAKFFHQLQNGLRAKKFWDFFDNMETCQKQHVSKIPVMEQESNFKQKQNFKYSAK